MHHGQVRIAYRLQRDYADRLMHVYGMGWFAWDGRRWARDERGEAKLGVLDVLRRALAESLDDKALRADVKQCETDAGIKGVLGIAAALPGMSFTVADLDVDPYLLNTAAGTVDLRTGELRGHAPADRITKITWAGYDRHAVSDDWAGFLARVLPDDGVRRFVQQLAGLGCLGKVVEHVLPILTGTGANGKSTFTNALGRAFGDYAITAEPDLFMHRDGGHPTGEMDLRGARWCVVSESDKDRRLAEATMKRLTGGDKIKARYMRQDFVEFAPSHTAVLVTNHLPKVSGNDPAVWRRLRVVPFDVVIPADERDPKLADRLELESDAILAWAVAGYADYQNSGLANPAAVLVATGDYQRSSDAVARFIAECCYLSPAAYATTSDLHRRWTAWAAEDGSDQLSLKAFGQELDRRGYEVRRTNSARNRLGIGLLAEEDE